MLDPDRTALRTKKKKKNASSPLIEAPVQSQDAKVLAEESRKIHVAFWRLGDPLPRA